MIGVVNISTGVYPAAWRFSCKAGRDRAISLGYDAAEQVVRGKTCRMGTTRQAHCAGRDRLERQHEIFRAGRAGGRFRGELISECHAERKTSRRNLAPTPPPKEERQPG